MKAAPLPNTTAPALLGVTIGNTRTRVGLFHGRELVESSVCMNADQASHIAGIITPLRAAGELVVAVAEVDAANGDGLERAIRDRFDSLPVGRLGRDIPIDLNHRLDDDGAQTVGQDRLLCAIGAFARTQQATAVVDAGTCITVDFVDGEGTFCGGAIAPGLRLLLDAMHSGTEQLPQIDFKLPPEDEPFGVNTPDAMRQGALSMLRGMVRHQVERFAAHYGAYPQVVATGGDAGVLEADELVEHIVPDLQLIGLQVCVEKAAAGVDQ